MTIQKELIKLIQDVKLIDSGYWKDRFSGITVDRGFKDSDLVPPRPSLEKKVTSNIKKK